MIIRAVNFAADDIKLSGQLYLPEDAGVPEYPTVCVCHGSRRDFFYRMFSPSQTV